MTIANQIRRISKQFSLATTVLAAMLCAVGIYGQETEVLDGGMIETHSVLDQGELQPLPSIPEIANPTIDQQVELGVGDEELSNVEGVEILTLSPKFNAEALSSEAWLQYDASPQAIQTKEWCPLKKRMVYVAHQDEIWLVSAREAHQCSDLSRVSVFRLQNEVWQPSLLESLTSSHSNDLSKSTVIYCHGNRTDFDWAKSRGLQVYQSTFHSGNNQGECSRPAVRFVIFSWKSEQEKIRLRPDYQIKSKRALAVGKTFGKFLGRFEDRNMVLSGFSLGSQVILTGVSSCEIAQSNATGRYQVALVAPALDASFVCRSLQKLPENSLIQRTEVFANEKDRAIKAAQKIAAKTCREWLPEFKKLACSSSFAMNPIQINDIGRDISRQHSTTNYFNSARIRRVHLEMLNQVHAAQRQSLPTMAVEELSELDLQPAGTLGVQPALVAPE